MCQDADGGAASLGLSLQSKNFRNKVIGTMSLQLQPPCPLDMSSSSNVATNWKKFKEAFGNYEIAIGIDEGNDKRRVAIFLHVIREAGVEKYNTMTWAEPDDKLRINKVIENFDKECSP